MLGLGRSLPVFQQPPCICDEIEGRVREAIAMRDEMAKWDTPLEAWIKLQQMPVLVLKSEPKQDDWSRSYDEALTAKLDKEFWRYEQQKATAAWEAKRRREDKAKVLATANPYRLGTLYDGVPMTLRLLPGEPFEVGSILTRGDRRYQIVQRLYDNTNCVRVNQL